MLPRLSRTYIGLLVIGGILAVFGGSCEVIGIAAAISPGKDSTAGAGLIIIGFATVAFVIPAALMIGYGLKRRKRVAQLEKLDALAAVSARLPLDTVAAELLVDTTKARELILDGVRQGLLRGRLDLEQGIFFSVEAETSFPQRPFHCRKCGSTTQMTVVPGQWPTCPYCHAPG